MSLNPKVADRQSNSHLRRDEILLPQEIESITRTTILTSGHINAAQTMLWRQFPSIGGLFCTTLGASLSFPAAAGKWLQILHSGTDHWLLAASGFEADHVVIYDSLNFQNATRQHVLCCISSLVKTKEKQMRYIVKSCQRQENGYDCGVFAIAFATSVAFGQDPSTIVYDTKLLRKHLVNCLKKGIIDLFPVTAAVRSSRCSREKIAVCNVYCHCRRTAHNNMSENFESLDCSRCKDKFHRMCDSPLPTTKQARKKWLCKNCR